MQISDKVDLIMVLKETTIGKGSVRVAREDMPVIQAWSNRMNIHLRLDISNTHSQS